MTLLHELIRDSAAKMPERPALGYRGRTLEYGLLWQQVQASAAAIAGLGLGRGERIGIYLEKRLETVIAMFAAAAAGCVLVPINPVLKPRQVGYIMRDCNVRLLVTSGQRV